MPSIYYERSDGEVYQVDEVSQRILVYAYIHGQAGSESVVDPAGVENEHQVHSRVDSQLGPSAAGLVDTETSTQMTLGNNPGEVFHSFVLTETGESFVKEHRADLSMPMEIAELAKRVAALQITDGVVDRLRDQVEDLEERVRELEDSN
jgi:hypothetical protein